VEKHSTLYNVRARVVGPIVLGVIADGYGLRMSFYFMAVMILVNSVLVLAFARETYSARRRKE